MVVSEPPKVKLPENRVGPSPPVAIVEPQRSKVSAPQEEDSSSDVEIIDLEEEEEDEKPGPSKSKDSAQSIPQQPGELNDYSFIDSPEEDPESSMSIDNRSPLKPVPPKSTESDSSSSARKPVPVKSNKNVSSSSRKSEPVKSNESDSSSSRKSVPKPSGSNINSPKKPIPPPPPPPALSKIKEQSARAGPASFKRKLAEQENEKIKKPASPPTSSISVKTSRQENIGSKSKSSSSNKQQLKERHPAAKASSETKSPDKSKRSKKELKRKRPVVSSSESEDQDDSSDGLPHNEGKFVPNPDFNPDADELKEPKKELNYSSLFDEDPDEEEEHESKTTKRQQSIVSRKQISSQSLKAEILGRRRIPRVLLKKCVTEQGGAVRIRKKFASKMSPPLLDKVLRQYHESAMKMKKKYSRLRDVSDSYTSTSDDSDSDIFTPVVVTDKIRQEILNKEAKKRKKEEEESSNVSSDSDMEVSEDSDSDDKYSVKKRKKEEKKSKPKEVEKKKSNPTIKNTTPSKSIPSTGYSPSNDEPQPGCSKDFYPPSASSAYKKRPSQESSSDPDENMDYSDEEVYKSEGEKDESDKTTRREDIQEANQGRRTIKMLDHAPLPRQFRKPSDKSKPNNNTVPAESFYKQRSPLTKQFSHEEAKKARQERLQQIEAKKKAEEESRKFQTAPKTVPAPVKAKIQSRNRNQHFVDDLLNSNKEPPEKDTEKSPPAKEVAKNIPAPRREIPLPAISPSKMPVSLITREMDRSKQEHENRTRLAPPVIPPPVANELVKRNILEKEGSSIARANNPTETSHKTIINYYHGQAEPVKSVVAPKPGRQDHEHFEMPEDEAYITISRWNPAWLHEEQNTSAPPPLFPDKDKDGNAISLTRTRYNYDTYKSYMDVMFPLLMLEIWATIGSEYFETRKSDMPSHLSVSNEINEFHFVIEKVTRESVCPIISSRKVFKDRNWTTLSCYALEPVKKKFHVRKDLAIIRIPVGTTNADKKERQFFGWIIYKSQSKSPIEGKVHDDLRRATPDAKTKYTFQVVISTSEKIIPFQVGHMKKVCYINSKLRDFKALSCLRVSSLFPKIINVQPPTPTHLFDPKAPIPPHYLIPYVSKLNPIQKSIVMHVSERVAVPGPELMLLHGAPGVGKSRTIVAMILQILSKIANQPNHKKILVCTPSNTAIDELMCRIDEALPELPNRKSINMIRVGDIGSTNPKLKKYTLDSVGKHRLEMSSTTANILKEIDQANRELEDKKLEIELGVKNKLSRTTIESLRREQLEIQKRRDDYQKDLETKRKAVKEGELNRAKSKAIQEATIICATLTTCSNSMLANEFGYKSKSGGKAFACCIIDEATQATEPETLNPLLLQIDKMILVGDPCQLGPTVLSSYAQEKQYGLSLFSRLHHYYTVQLKIPNAVMMLTQQYRMHPEIITWPNDAFYKGCLKTTTIRSERDTCPLTPYIFLNLSGRESKVDGELNAVANQVEVDTVDSFQGREKDIIIISCVRTESTGFLSSKLRLNVALTRAKHSLIIIGDAECLRKESMWNDLIENAKTRGRITDIHEASIRNNKHLNQKLFGALSPSKSVVNRND